jgi:hypothetical protein
MHWLPLDEGERRRTQGRCWCELKKRRWASAVVMSGASVHVLNSGRGPTSRLAVRTETTREQDLVGDRLFDRPLTATLRKVMLPPFTVGGSGDIPAPVVIAQQGHSARFCGKQRLVLRRVLPARHQRGRSNASGGFPVKRQTGRSGRLPFRSRG